MADDLGEEIEEITKLEEAIRGMHSQMKEFLIGYTADFKGEHPEIAELLNTELSQEHLAELYSALMDSLDEADTWAESDILEAAALFMLMAIGTSENEDGDEESEDDNG